MRNICTSLSAVFLFAVLVLSSCNRKQDESYRFRLQQWAILCDSLPEAIRDSLSTVDPSDLSFDNRALHGLLRTITDDKTHFSFTSDSLINRVEAYYRWSDYKSRNHVRSLIYQGIVRVRMNVTDSTVYKPLKEALAILHSQKDPDPTLLYYANHYIGYIHRECDSNDVALFYFQQASAYAKLENNALHLFDIYRKLFWLRMSENEYDDARLYLDTLATHARTPEDNYFLLNAKAVYLDMQGEYWEALKKEEEQMQLSCYLKGKPEYYKIYYFLSNRYFNLNRLDNALYYARRAIDHIEDSTYRLNYLLYENAADIAAEMNDYRLADDYRRQALKAYDISVKGRLDTQIQELEKRYDLAEVKNLAQKAGNQFRFILLLSAFGLFFTVSLILYFSKQRAIVRLQQEKLTEEINRAEAELKLSREQSENQRQLLLRYDLFLKFHAEQEQQIRKMSDKIWSKYPALANIYDKMLKIGQQQFSRLVKDLFTAEDMQRLFNIHDDEDILTESDRLLLFMLANNADNEQIAALLNTNVNNLKSKKSYLKKKISTFTTPANGFQCLLQLF